MTGETRAPEAADTIVSGTVVTMGGARRVITDGAVAIRGGSIVAVGPAAAIGAAFTAAEQHGGPDAIVLPGFLDCHTHATQTLLRGLIAGELPMIYRLYLPADMALTPEEAHVAAKLCAVQLARSGVTTVCDFETNVSDEHEDAVLAALRAVGVRCHFLRSRGDQEMHHAALYSQIGDRSWRRQRIGEAEKDLARTAALIARHADDPYVFVGVCPSGLTGFSDDYFRQAHALAVEKDARLHVHAARDREEVEFSLAVFGCRPIERLAELGVIDERLVVVHGMLASANEIALLGAARANLAHSAVEVANILARVPDIAMMRRLGVTVGLGCDNAVNDMFIVMHSAWLMHTVTRGIAGYDPDVMNEADVLAMATSEAAAALGLGARLGSIDPGKVADLVILDSAAPHLWPVQDLMPELVRAGSRAEVRTVLVGGRAIVEDGEVISVDVGALRAEAAEIARKLDALVAPRRYTVPTRRRALCC
jgi:5-methylthioadenosine/S-adenosylhomocysteine deaminase